MQVIFVMVSKSICPIAPLKSYMVYMPAVLVAAGIAVLSLVEKEHAPEMPMGDKWSHCLAYCVLCICLMTALLVNGHKRWRWWLLTVVSCTAYGLLMEALQRFCTLTRSGEMADLVADFLGVVFGVLVVFIFEIATSRHPDISK